MRIFTRHAKNISNHARFFADHAGFLRKTWVFSVILNILTAIIPACRVNLKTALSVPDINLPNYHLYFAPPKNPRTVSRYADRQTKLNNFCLRVITIITERNIHQRRASWITTKIFKNLIIITDKLTATLGSATGCKGSVFRIAANTSSSVAS